MGSENGHTITTWYWPKPIPDRQFDWSAYLEGNEEGKRGYGKSERAAIDDLLDLLED